MLKTDYKFQKTYPLPDIAENVGETVLFRSLMENNNGGISMLLFRKGQELGKHIAPAEVLVFAVEGKVEFEFAEHREILNKGDFMLLGVGLAHSVRALENARIMLVKLKSDK